jgi:hypothetical protein
MKLIKSTFGSYFVSYNSQKNIIDTTKKVNEASKFTTATEAEEQIKKLNSVVPQYGWVIE